MKIAVVTDDGRTLSGHLGRAESFLVVTVQEGKVVERELRKKLNRRHTERDFHPESTHAHSGPGECEHHDSGHHQHHHHAEVVALISDCEVVLSAGMGPGIYEDLQKAGIKPVLTKASKVEEAIRAYLEGRLEEQPGLVCRKNNARQ